MSMRLLVAVVLASLLSTAASAQVVLTGKVTGPRAAGIADDRVPYTGIYAFASPAGAQNETLSFRTWETVPAGWFRLEGAEGRYAVAFTNPASFMRPIVMTNVFARDGETINLAPSPRADYAMFHEKGYDTKPAIAYYQTFTATGAGVTHIGFRLAHDGVDGAGPGKQNLLLTVHRKGDGDAKRPDTWTQVGPAASVLDVDSGGPKNYIWSASFSSGEVATKPGEVCAVCVRAEKEGGSFQAFWRETPENAAGESGCYRIGKEGQGFTGKQLWMNIAGDGDGLLIPYAKRVHRPFGEFAGFSMKWTQTYKAQGHGLASVVLYAAVGGAQPELRRQRISVTVREDGPGGKLVGNAKIAVGNGNYTGDASWGVFGCVLAPGEVNLTPGKTYAIDFESIENHDSLHGYVNIKGVVSDGRPGFNPYRKQPGDAAGGKAYRHGSEATDFGLDMQVIEYENTCPSAPDWTRATHAEQLMTNGSMETGRFDADAVIDRVEAWSNFIVGDAKATLHRYITFPNGGRTTFGRITGDHEAKLIDGGFTQRIENLDKRETYLLSLKVRCNWPLDTAHACMVGYDPTGQTKDPEAKSIVWTKLPGVHGLWLRHESEPVRPVADAISVWLRGRTTRAHDKNAPFRADFDDVTLRRVRTDVPSAKD